MFLRFLFILFCFGTLHKDVATITWSESYKLSWSDFKGPAKNDVDAVATTASGITFSYSIKRTSTSNRVVGFKTKIFAHFYPEKSWYKADQADNHILAHEQFHFNITELYARKFRQRVAALNVTPTLSEQLDSIHQEINQELSALQYQYDTETNYSRNYEQQAVWQKRVKQELTKLANFKSKE